MEHAFAADLFGQIKSSLIVLSTPVGMNDSIFHAQLIFSRDVLGADLVRFPSRQRSLEAKASTCGSKIADFR